MRNLLAACFLTLGPAPAWADTAPSTWSGTDELLRTLPLAGDSTVGAEDPDVKVGMFYYLWHGSEPNMTEVYDVSAILEADSINPAWGPSRKYHWGSRPWFGYYKGGDGDVVARHLQMLCDAGVDFLVFDCTNGPTYPANIHVVMKAIDHRKAHRQRAPKLVCMIHSRQNQAFDALWNEFYSNPAYDDYWMRIDGKPLLLCDLMEPFEGERKTRADLFTLRHSWAWCGGGENTWSWLDYYPQQPGYILNNGHKRAEAISVSPAQHATTAIGKSYHSGSQPSLDRRGLCDETPLGLYFAEQWQRAIDLHRAEHVPVLMITQWNEHIAIRFMTDDPSGADPGKVRPGAAPTDSAECYFVDVYNAEFNRDLEPSSHPLIRDNYYMQLVDGIRRYRGVEPQPAPRKLYSISHRSPAEEWEKVTPSFADDEADHRFSGTAQGELRADIPANDIVECKIASDGGRFHFMARCSDDVKLHSSDNMRMLADTDSNPATGWYGYDIMARYNPSKGNYSILRHTGERNEYIWEEIPEAVKHSVNDRQIVLSVDCRKAGIAPWGDIDFKWTDCCPLDSGEPMLMYSDGDCAPNSRFNYRFRASALPAGM